MSRNIIDYRFKLKLFSTLNLLIFLLSILSAASVHAADLCMEGKKELRGEYEIIQGDGGLWALMERSSSLKKVSTLGFQVDNKLMRLVTIFETICAEPSKDNTIPDIYEQIRMRIDRGRSFQKIDFGKTSSKVFLTELKAFSQNLDVFVKSLGL